MNKINFLVSDEGHQAIRKMGAQKLRGRVWLERQNGKEYLRFEPYRQNNKKCAHIVVGIVVIDASKLNVEPLNLKEDVKI